jgi:iron complex outermembrane receptor protein
LTSVLVAIVPAAVRAAESLALDPVVITVERQRQPSFDAPAAISTVTRDTLDSGGPQVNLSEVMNRVPGISVLNRQNYAQDLQMSIRGFGARSTFGIRGVRLIVDGIPATTPDGQAQASSIVLSSASRIEVLRGPLAQLYGNAAGGVVQVFTDVDSPHLGTTGSAFVGPYGQRKLDVRFSGNGADDAVVLDASHFRTNGYREHSAARRDQFNMKWQHDAGADTRVSVVLNGLDQPFSQDPLGLTRAQFESHPEQAIASATTLDTRKTVNQAQIGAVLEQRLGDSTALTARVYFGTRDLDNALSILPQFQAPVTASGGIVSFARGYAGAGMQVSHAVKFGETSALRLVAGVDVDHLNEDRKGFLNNGGVAGALKRNEHNEVGDLDVFAQGSLDLGPSWSLTAGLRSSRVRFQSLDFFIVPNTANGNDSGSVSYRATNPVAGVTWHASPSLNVYANVGRGFETPTLTELSYRNVGSGLNTDLRASRSTHVEVGTKWKLAAEHRIDAAVFDISTADELVVDTNVGGRTTYKNASRTRRSGLELAYLGRLAADWTTTLSLTALNARFTADTFEGNRLPGTPGRSAFAELAWAPAHSWGGLNGAVEFVHTGAIYVNDVNEDKAPAVSLLNLRVGMMQTYQGWTFTERARVDNATDRRYAGSVIVNQANKQFFEPALPRNWQLSLTARYEWE